MTTTVTPKLGLAYDPAWTDPTNPNWPILDNSVQDARAVNTTSPLAGGGALTTDRTISLTLAPNPGLEDVAGLRVKVANGLQRTASGVEPVYGGAANTVCQGNDARLADARTPTPHHATHEPGGSDAMAVDAIAAIGSLRTLGAGAQQACAGSDARLSNARFPTPHDHTTADGSGVLTNDEHDGFIEIAESATPAAPAANRLRV